MDIAGWWALTSGGHPRRHSSVILDGELRERSDGLKLGLVVVIRVTDILRPLISSASFLPSFRLKMLDAPLN